MSFNILAVRTADDDDGALYPVLAEPDELFQIALEAEDGPDILPFEATGLTVINASSGKLVQVSRLKDAYVDLYVTDSRVIVACDKYDKGGSWVGFGAAGAAAALTFTAVSRVRAARRRRGTCLAGHIRYPWLTAVGATTYAGRGTGNSLRLRIQDGTTDPRRLMILQIDLPKDADSPRIAARIARRCARRRLDGNITPDHEHRAAFEALTRARPLPPEPNHYLFHKFPNYYGAHELTAYK